MARHLKKLATSLLTAIGFTFPTEQERMQANMVIFCANLLVVFVNAKLDLYFFNKIMTGSHLERQLAETYVRYVMVLYAGLVLMSWFLFKETFVNPFYQPPDIFIRWRSNAWTRPLQIHPMFCMWWLHSLSSFSSLSHCCESRVASRRARMVVIGTIVAMLCANVYAIQT
jgi:hypothetical protein